MPIKNWKPAMNRFLLSMEIGFRSKCSYTKSFTYSIEGIKIENLIQSHPSKQRNDIDYIMEYIKNNQGVRTNKISEYLSISENIVEKRLRKLKSENKIEFKGSKKTGGYFIIEGE